MDRRNCKACGDEFVGAGDICPECGHDNSKEIERTNLVLIGSGIMIVVGLASLLLMLYEAVAVLAGYESRTNIVQLLGWLVLMGIICGPIFGHALRLPVILAATCLAFSAPASGNTLIAELRHTLETSSPQSGTMPTSVRFQYRSAPNGGWDTQATDAEVGQTFDAPSDLLDEIRNAWANGSFGATVTTGWMGPLDYWITKGNAPPVSHTFTALVPDPANYHLTNITRTIDAVTLESLPTPGHWIQGGAQTIRFYGVDVQPLPGDFNKNGEVDGADFVLWRKRFQPPIGTAGDLHNESGNTPGFIAGEDQQFWRSQFGHSNLPQGAALGSAAVPEPCGVALMAWAAVTILYLSLSSLRNRVRRIEKQLGIIPDAITADSTSSH